jgi:glycosyltransferase involved in cell wall biosynthesis
MTGHRLQTFALVASEAASLIDFRGDLIRAVLARGHRVVCLAPAVDESVRATLEQWGAEVQDLPLDRSGLNPLADLLYILRLWALLRHLRPDVVMGYTPKPSTYAIIAGWLAGIPRRVPLVTGLGFAFIEPGNPTAVLAQRAARLLYWVAFRCATGVVFQNSDNRARLEGLGLLKKTLAVTVVKGSGIALERFPRSPLPPLDEGFVFVLVGRLVRYKGVLEFAQAACHLTTLYPQARFLIIGMAEKGPAALSEREEKIVRESVEVIGPLTMDEVRQVLLRSHVFVLPSYGEGMPRSTLEAMAVGRAIVSTQVSGCRETVEEGVNGFLVPARDMQALASAMQRFLDDPSLACSMGAASRRIVERDFDVRQINKRMVDALSL